MKFDKKNVWAFAILICMQVNGLFSQDWYTGVSAGYGIGLSKTGLGANSILYQTTRNMKLELITGSYGKGFCMDATFGKKINPNVSVEILGCYFSGSGYKETFQTFDGQNGIIFPYTGSFSVRKIQQIRISPGIKISAVTGKKTELFIKLGAIAGIGTSFMSILDDPDPLFPIYKEEKYSKNLAYGFRASLGASYKLTGKTYLFFEVASNNLSWAPGKSEIVKFTTNNIDRIPSMSTSELQTNYKKEYGNPIVNKSEPTNALKQYYSFNSLVFSVGFIYRFGASPDKT